MPTTHAAATATRTAYALDGEHSCLRHDAEYTTLRLSVLCDVDDFDTLVNLDVYVRRSHDSGALSLVTAIRTDSIVPKTMLASELPGLVEWLDNDLTLWSVCADLRVEGLWLSAICG